MFKRGPLLGVVRSVVLAAALLAGATASDAQDRNVSAELKEVRRRIEREEERLAGLRKRQSEIKASLDVIAQDAARIERDKATLQESIKLLAEKARELELTVAEGRKLVEESRGALGKRIAAIYKMHRRSGAVLYLSKANSATNLLKRASYLARITANDRARLDKVDALIARLDSEREALQGVQQQRAHALTSLSNLERQLEEQKIKQAALLDEANAEEQTQVAALQKLQGSAQELEALLAEIMGSEKPEVAPGPKVTPAPKRADDLPDVAPFKGPGLASLKGRLPLPVEGSLVQRFGKQRHDEFADMLFIKGLEFRAPTGTRVAAVAPGRVIFNQVLPGYGNVVIIDHGERYYSLYGRLASALARVGDDVARGDVIAILGQEDRKGRNFYFELRIRGKPVDPLTYFGEKPPTANP